MIIAEHHRPGHWRHDPSETAFKPACAWPDDCTVQWGGSGVVIGDGNSSRVTAFFEAFPGPGGFIRGEGATIEDAERSAFAKLQKYEACDDHVYGRRGYNNGAGFCVKCGHFKSGAFAEVYKIGEWKKPLRPSEAWLLRDSDNALRNRDPESAKYYRKLALRKAAFGVEKDAPPRGGLDGLLDRIFGDEGENG